MTVIHQMAYHCQAVMRLIINEQNNFTIISFTHLVLCSLYLSLSLCIYKYLLSLRLTKLAYMLAYDVFRTGEIWFGLVK